MKTHTIPLLLGVLALWGVSAVDAHEGHDHGALSHDHAHSHSHEHGSMPGHSHADALLAYRLTDWQSAHFNDAQSAQQHLHVLQALGCESRMNPAVAGGMTVTYRCSEWRTLELADHDQTHQWSSWLGEAGFDCSHGHVDPVMLNGPEPVEFRLAEWHTAAVQPGEFAAIVDLLEKIGCEVQHTRSGDQFAVSFRSPVWRTIHVENRQLAEQWVSFLERHAFEVHYAVGFEQW